MEINEMKAGEIGKILLESRKEGPENIRPEGLDNREYANWLTFVIALDYLKDADKLWRNARKAVLDPHYKYLFDPYELRQTQLDEIGRDLRDCGISIFFNKDAKYIKKIAGLIKAPLKGDIRNLFIRGNYDAVEVLKELNNFPLLRGKKLSLFWLRVMHDLVEPRLDISNIPIPVDVHVARFTLKTGVLTGEFKGRISQITPEVQMSWDVAASVLDVYPCIFDEPIWSISKYICDRCDECPVVKHCSRKKVLVTSQRVVTQK